MKNEKFYMEILSDKVQMLLDKNSLSSLELGNRSGVDKSKISRVLNKKGLFTIPELFAISDALNIDINYFLKDDIKLNLNLIPVVELSKSEKNENVHSIAVEDDIDSNAVGIYISQNLSSMLLPSKTIIIVNIMSNTKYQQNPIVFYTKNKLLLGLRKNSHIVSIENGQLYSEGEVDILGDFVKQMIKTPKLNHKRSTCFLKNYLSNVTLDKLKYSYLYKLLASS